MRSSRCVRVARYGAFTFILLLAGCGPAAYRWMESDYTVRRGDTLYSIAFNHNLDYRALARWNGIGPPYTIYPGQQIRLEPPPGAAPSPARTASAPPPAPSEPEAEGAGPASDQRAVRREPPQDGVAATPVSQWQWPARGTLLDLADGGVEPKGINIAGEVGQPIRAAASGRVVYSGNGLPGYGLLLIIKHNEHFLSAYGHNRRLMVREGDRVGAGQVIAHMGFGPHRQPMLHFEIRQNGKPVDPRRFLPPLD